MIQKMGTKIMSIPAYSISNGQVAVCPIYVDNKTCIGINLELLYNLPIESQNELLSEVAKQIKSKIFKTAIA